MSYGLKYTVHCDNQFGGDSRQFRIYKSGYSGSDSDIDGGPDPVVVRYMGQDADVFDPIMGSEAIVTILCSTSEQYIEFSTASSKGYMGILYNDTDDYEEWYGYLVPEEYEEPYNQAPYFLTLRFTCGLGMLADIPYQEMTGGFDYGTVVETGGDLYRGRQRLCGVLGNCLQKLYTTSQYGTYNMANHVIMELLEDSLSTALTSSSFLSIYVDRDKYLNNDGTPWNCLDVLRDILAPFGAIIKMAFNGFWVIRVRDMAKVAAGHGVSVQIFKAWGNYDSNSYRDDARSVFAISAASSSRDTMNRWIEQSALLRIERPQKEARVLFDYGYRNMLMAGDFRADNWEDDFWVRGGTVTRKQSGSEEVRRRSKERPDRRIPFIEDRILDANKEDQGDYYVEISGASTLHQIIENLESMSDQNFLLIFDAMMYYTDSLSAAVFRMEVLFDADAGSASDRYLAGTYPGALSWTATPSTLFTFSSEGGLPGPDEWIHFEFRLPDLPGAGDLRIMFYYATGTGGSVLTTNFRNVKLLGTYDWDAPTKQEERTIEINTNNLNNPAPTEIHLGDVDEEGNEGKYFFNALTTDAAGQNKTNKWRSYRVPDEGGSRVGVGPTQELIDFLLDGIATQHGEPRRRIQGRANFDATRSAYGVMLWKETQGSDRYYWPVASEFHFKHGIAALDLVELPAFDEVISGLASNLITGWTNDGWETLSSSGATITSLVDLDEGDGDAYADTITYKANERFRIQAEGTWGEDDNPYLTWEDIDEELTDGFDEILTPDASAGSAAPHLENSTGGPVTVSSLVITITRLYGY